MINHNLIHTQLSVKKKNLLKPSPFPHVILVDSQDNQVGIAEKIDVHQKGVLHRAFSVCLYCQTVPHLPQKLANTILGNFEILLQKRNQNKYHSGGLWSNTCCSHPQPEQDIQKEAERSLLYEMGITATLKEIKVFHYTGLLGNGFIENEIDHVFVGKIEEQTFSPNFEEIENHRWMSLLEVQKDLQTSPNNQFTIWFPEVFTIFCEYVEQNYVLRF